MARRSDGRPKAYRASGLAATKSFRTLNYLLDTYIHIYTIYYILYIYAYIICIHV